MVQLLGCAVWSEEQAWMILVGLFQLRTAYVSASPCSLLDGLTLASLLPQSGKKKALQLRNDPRKAKTQKPRCAGWDRWCRELRVPLPTPASSGYLCTSCEEPEGHAVVFPPSHPAPAFILHRLRRQREPNVRDGGYDRSISSRLF